MTPMTVYPENPHYIQFRGQRPLTAPAGLDDLVLVVQKQTGSHA